MRPQGETNALSRVNCPVFCPSLPFALNSVILISDLAVPLQFSAFGRAGLASFYRRRGTVTAFLFLKH